MSKSILLVRNAAFLTQSSKVLNTTRNQMLGNNIKLEKTADSGPPEF